MKRKNYWERQVLCMSFLKGTGAICLVHQLRTDESVQGVDAHVHSVLISYQPHTVSSSYTAAYQARCDSQARFISS
jgi:hypothetical protein